MNIKPLALSAAVLLTLFLGSLGALTAPAEAATCKFTSAGQLKAWLVQKSTFSGRWKGGSNSGHVSVAIVPSGLIEWDGQAFKVKFVNKNTFKFHGGKKRGPVTATVKSNCRITAKQYYPKSGGGGAWIVKWRLS